jgi:hypothetical protein
MAATQVEKPSSLMTHLAASGHKAFILCLTLQASNILLMITICPTYGSARICGFDAILSNLVGGAQWDTDICSRQYALVKQA